MITIMRSKTYEYIGISLNHIIIQRMVDQVDVMTEYGSILHDIPTNLVIII